MNNDDWNEWQDNVNSSYNSDEDREQVVDLFNQEMEKDDWQ